MSKFQKNLIFDSHAVCHFLKYSLSHLSYGDTDTGIIFGFLSVLKVAIERLGTNNFVFAFDSKKSHRKRLFPLYKVKRREKIKTEQERIEDAIMYSQIDALRKKILPDLGFHNVFQKPGFEADDIITSCVQSMPGKSWIVSRDNDFHQLLNSKISMWDFQKRVEFTAGDFTDKWLIPPKEWRQVKCLAGCTSDCVPGIPRIGEKTAIKFLKGEMPQHLKAYQSIIDNQDIVNRNIPLVILPFKGTPKYKIQKDQLKIQSFFKLFEEMGFESYINDFDSWVEVFKLT